MNKPSLPVPPLQISWATTEQIATSQVYVTSAQAISHTTAEEVLVAAILLWTAVQRPNIRNSAVSIVQVHQSIPLAVTFLVWLIRGHASLGPWVRAPGCALSDPTYLDVYIHVERIQTALLEVVRHALSRQLSGVAAQEPYGLPMPGGRRLREVHSMEGVLSEQGKVPLRDQIRILHGHILPRPSLYSILSSCALQTCTAYVSQIHTPAKQAYCNTRW